MSAIHDLRHVTGVPTSVVAHSIGRSMALRTPNGSLVLWISPGGEAPGDWAHLPAVPYNYAADTAAPSCDYCRGRIADHTWRVTTATTAVACSGAVAA